jgi:hypothetical protein
MTTIMIKNIHCFIVSFTCKKYFRWFGGSFMLSGLLCKLVSFNNITGGKREGPPLTIQAVAQI